MLLLYSLIALVGVVFVFIVYDAYRHRRKKSRRPLNFHYTMTGRADEWSRKSTADETVADKARRPSRRKTGI
jgi:hypothetical protein